MNNEKKVVILTVALLVIAAVVVVLVWGVYSNWFRTDFEHVYLTCKGERLQQSEVYCLGDVNFDVHQFGIKSDFTVKVKPVNVPRIYFSLDGFTRQLDMDDVSAAFNISSSKSSFTIRCKNLSLDKVLSALYPDAKEILVPEQDSPTLYNLVVADDAGHYFEITFCCKVDVSDIEIDPDHVYV